MFKSVVASVFVAVISLVPMTALGKPGESIMFARSSSSVVSSTFNKQSLIDATDIRGSGSIGAVKSAAAKPHGYDTNEPTLFSGWLLAGALLGFVMLSNRRGV
jgi:hypothetical protein